MPANLIKKNVITTLAARAAGLDNRDGNPRVKQVVTPIHFGRSQPAVRPYPLRFHPHQTGHCHADDRGQPGACRSRLNGALAGAG